jgi:hypothetical protein
MRDDRQELHGIIVIDQSGSAKGTGMALHELATNGNRLEHGTGALSHKLIGSWRARAEGYG